MVNRFSVSRRNPGHWDVYANDSRAFAVRGAPGKYYVRDERARGTDVPSFRTLDAAMGYICAELTHEVIVVEGQDFTVLQPWET